MFVLQRMVLPSTDFSFVPQHMYLRSEDQLKINDGVIRFCAGSEVSFDTFFNSFSVSAWKKECDINTLALKIKGEGICNLRLILFADHKKKCLFELQGDLGRLSKLDLDFWKNLNEGILYIEIKALTDAVIEDISFCTHDRPNYVKMGVVITHYNRKDTILPVINRISKELISDNFSSGISLVIVDNSQNLLPNEVFNSIVLPNKNLGGSGGFTRGLLYLKDHDFTHCLFMDDDGNCDVESIKRTYAFFSFAKKKKNISLSGTLLLKHNPSVIWEKGGILSIPHGGPAHHLLNLKSLESLYHSELQDDRVNYGAWCFFAFSINDINYYSFPFFVRGDDMLFSVLNHLRIVTINGIAVWIDDFGLKESPYTRYFGLRGAMVANLIAKTASIFDCFLLFTVWYFRQLFSYNYDSVNAIAEAFLFFLRGPEAFAKDAESIESRKKMEKIVTFERMNAVDVEKFEKNSLWKKKNVLILLFRSLTLNGLLLPNCFLLNKTLLCSKNFSANLSEIFGYKSICYFDPISRKGYITSHNKKLIFYGVLRYVRLVMIFIFNCKKVKQLYQNSEFYMSELFWRSLF